jgi:hypothetical protein
MCTPGPSNSGNYRSGLWRELARAVSRGWLDPLLAALIFRDAVDRKPK